MITKIKFITYLLISFSSTSLWSWYYPEHAIIADKALKFLPPQVEKVLNKKYKSFARYNQKKGFQLCDDLNSPFYDDTKEKQAKCVPYSSLAAMASDHSTDITELKSFLKQSNSSDSIALQLVRGSQDHWQFVLGRMAQEMENDKIISDGERRNLLRRLDIFLTLTDPGYLTRAKGGVTHFSPGDDDIRKVLNELVTVGRSDNALNQFIIHHLRSLQHAALARKSKDKRDEYLWIAFLEHAFAMHFFQDAFASGHIIMFDPYLTAESSYSRLMRHDYFNRNGISVTRMLTPISCSFSRMMKNAQYIPNFSDICWTTYGDAFLGKGDGMDLQKAAEGNAMVQAQFAMALSPQSFKKYGDIEYCRKNKKATSDILDQVNAFPYWITPVEAKGNRRWTCRERTLVINGVLTAINNLTKIKKITAINSNSNDPNPKIVDKETLGNPIDKCVATDQWKIDKKVIRKTSRYCPSGKAIYLGNPGTSLIRPFLASWPISQSDKTGFFGKDPFETGFSWQLGLTTPYIYRFGDFNKSQLGANFQGGVSYRLQHVLASDPNFGVAELWAGLYNSGVFTVKKAIPVSMLTVDFRTMVPTMALTALFRKLIYAIFIKDRPSYQSLVSQFDMSLFVFSGFRWNYQFVILDNTRQIGGWDIEVINLSFPLNDTIMGVERFSRIPTQLRLRMGRDTYQDAFTVGLEFAFGVSRPF
ncbi:MAG: hypothetical protein DRQ88_09495 [Epsilonproteobacteria bacterium]|nr:MAG: hypothetical protein DRQ88_09495 [Campylobacterota bacterium]